MDYPQLSTLVLPPHALGMSAHQRVNEVIQLASQRLTCKTCKRKFSRPLGSRRIYCESCRPPRVKRDPVAERGAETPRVPGELEVAVRAELERAGRFGTWRGAAALRIARECDTASGSQVSSLIKQLEVAMAAALDGVPPEPDFVDEVAERRRAVKSG